MKANPTIPSKPSDTIESFPGEMIAASGISLRMWRMYAYFWLVCLLFPLLALFQMAVSPAALAGAAGGLALFVGIYAFVMWPHPLRGPARTGRPIARSPFMSLGLALLVTTLTLAYGISFSWLFMGVSAVTGITLARRPAFMAIMALTLLTIGIDVTLSGALWAAPWTQIIPLALLVRGLGVDVIGLGRLSDALRELHRERKELARVAVAEERARLARDLHDLLGRTLSTVALKSELAGRIMETDSVGASREIHEIEYLARRALNEMREAVAGYRQQSLSTEMQGATHLLSAAGIELSGDCDVQSFPAPVESTLAWTIREGVTNVIRHSKALQCSIRIACAGRIASAEISNDGVQPPSLAGFQFGSGLSGLAERAAALGGRVEAGPHSLSEGIRFRLLVELPLDRSTTSSQGAGS